MDLSHKNRRSTSLVWYRLSYQKPGPGVSHVLTCSNVEGDQWFRTIHVDLLPYAKGIEWWAYITGPEDIIDEK